jgi:hypothetical protein
MPVYETPVPRVVIWLPKVSMFNCVHADSKDARTAKFLLVRMVTLRLGSSAP